MVSIFFVKYSYDSSKREQYFYRAEDSMSKFCDIMSDILLKLNNIEFKKNVAINDRRIWVMQTQ